MDMDNAKKYSATLCCHSLQGVIVIALAVSCAAGATGAYEDFKRLPNSVLAVYLGFTPQEILSCKQDKNKCPRPLIFDEKNYYITLASADNPPELAFWHSSKDDFLAVISTHSKPPKFYEFRNGKLNDATGQNMAKIIAKFGDGSNLYLDLPKIGTSIEFLRDGEQIGKGIYQMGQFVYRKTGLATASALLNSDLCRKYKCVLNKTGVSEQTITLTARTPGNPQFVLDLVVKGVDRPVYDLEIYKDYFRRPDTLSLIKSILTISNSTATISELQKVCAKPENNLEAQYLSCRDAAFSNKDYTIRIVD